MVPFRQFAAAAVAQAVRLAPLSDEKVTFAWRLAVGPAVAKATSVHLDKQGVLHVASADPQWRREVHRSKAIIRDRLQHLLGDAVVSAISADP